MCKYIKTEVFQSPYRRKEEELWDNGKRWRMVCAEREKREFEWKREKASRVESSRMEKEGEFEGQSNCCGKRQTKMVNRWSNDSVYLLPLCRRKKRDREEREKKKRARKSEARKTISMHIYYQCIIGGKERRRARREMTRQRVEGRLNIYWRSMKQKGQGE